MDQEAADDEVGIDVEVVVTWSGGQVELAMSLPGGASGGELADLLASRVPPRPRWLLVARTGQRIDGCTPVAAAGLIDGDELIVNGVADEERELVTIRATGPGIDVVRRSTAPVVLGRVTGSGTITLDHPTVSRRHAIVRVERTGAVIEDLGSTNGTIVAGRPIDRPTPIQPGQPVTVGDVVLSVEVGARGVRSLTGPHLDRRAHSVRLDRPPRVLEPDPAESIRIPEPPETPPNRRFPIAAAVAPLVLGGAMAWLFSPLFALFIALSPVIVVFTHVDDRISGRSAFRRNAERWRDDLAAVLVDARSTAEASAAWRRASVPPVEVLGRWAATVAPDLWRRGPADHDADLVAPADADRPGRTRLVVPERGDEELLAEAAEASAALGSDIAVPVAVDLRATPVVGICGDDDRANGVARSLLVQLATLNSPADVRLSVIALHHRERWTWVRWLPHVRSGRRRSIATTPSDAKRLLEQLGELASSRRLQVTEGRRGRDEPALPLHVVVVDGPEPLPASWLADIGDRPAEVGIAFIHLGVTWDDLPAAASTVVEVAAGGAATITFTRTGERIVGASARSTSLEDATRIARDLAPLVDATAIGGPGAMPDVVAFGDLVDGPPTTSVRTRLDETIARCWADPPRGLAAPVGTGPSGPLTLDLRSDGPHALIAGTTGAGKSELLQALVASLAVRHAPDRLNFILIDYKGGAAFRDCVDLPHTVGFVTDLDDRLADRALVSLRAELRSRERILAAAGAKDLAAMEAGEATAPPALVVVIDELAALRSEVPDFVDGLVDIAQRGRSMGVHLVLATQKPSGVVTGQIDANTNLRIALRTASASESTEVLGTGEAARLDRHRPGRALVKIGAGADGVVEVQSLYVGGRTLSAPATIEPTIRDVGVEPELARPVGAPGDPAAPTDLQVIVAATRAAWASAGGRPPHRPWQPPLPDRVPLAALVADGGGEELRVPVGLADHPAEQTQRSYHLDLARAGNVAVYGTARSGVTTLLSTIAVGLSLAHDAGRLTIHAVDGGSGGLGRLADLPTVGEVVPVRDLDRLLLLLSVLRRAVEGRRTSSGDPPIVLLIDGFGSLWTRLEEVGFGRACDDLVRLLADGPSVGIHAVLAADQRAAIPFACQGSIGLRVVGRLASSDDYAFLGVAPPSEAGTVTPGRMAIVDGPELQVAHPGPPVDDSSGAHPGPLVDVGSVASPWLDPDLGAAIAERHRSRPVAPLPSLAERMPAADLSPPVGPARVPIGWDDHLDEVALDLVAAPAQLIVGPRRSGRSTTLATLAQRLSPIVGDRRLIRCRPDRQSSSAGALDRDADGLWTSIVDHAAVAPAIDALADEIELRRISPPGDPVLVAIDDADDLFDGIAAPALERIVRDACDAGVLLFVTATTFAAAQSFSPWLRALRSSGTGLVLRPSGTADTDVFAAPLPRDLPAHQPAGRGLVVTASVAQPIHVGAPTSPPPPRGATGAVGETGERSPCSDHLPPGDDHDEPPTGTDPRRGDRHDDPGDPEQYHRLRVQDERRPRPDAAGDAHVDDRGPGAHVRG